MIAYPIYVDEQDQLSLNTTRAILNHNLNVETLCKEGVSGDGNIWRMPVS